MNNVLFRSRLPVKQYFVIKDKLSCRGMATKFEDTRTHTGQKWDCDDYRLVRFMHAPKIVNPNWAVNLIAEVPPKQISERVAWCDGGSGAEGHPRVYINLDKPGDHYCYYCSLRYVKIDH